MNHFKMSKVFNITPKWWNFAKSGHTGWNREREREREGFLEELAEEGARIGCQTDNNSVLECRARITNKQMSASIWWVKSVSRYTHCYCHFPFDDDQSGKARFSANLGQLLAEVDRVVSQVSDERDPLQRHALGAQQILLELHQGSSGINSIKLYSSVIRGGPQGRTYL